MLIVIHVDNNYWDYSEEEIKAFKNLRLLSKILEVFFYKEKKLHSWHKLRIRGAPHFLSGNNIVIDKSSKTLYIDYDIYGNKVYNISKNDVPTPEDFKNFFFEAMKILS